LDEKEKMVHSEELKKRLLNRLEATFLQTLTNLQPFKRNFGIFGIKNLKLIMDTVLLQITNHKAYKLLEDLEDLQILKVLKKSSEPKQKLSEFAGRLSNETTDAMQKYVEESRNEWEERLNKQF